MARNDFVNATVGGFVRTYEFEHLSLPILEHVKGPWERVVIDARLTVDRIQSVKELPDLDFHDEEDELMKIEARILM
ncbi:hypothetical protein SUGI_0868470 [Cryptomeria japonica]|nr:hypothetical protein SUGI_0868470 [Cryptomeria japonica]